MRRKSILDIDRVQIGYLTYNCCNPACTEARWECGTPRFMTAQHFDKDGMCKHRQEQPVPEQPESK